MTDLGRLLYASLVCRWPGGPAFGLPNAPMVGRRWMSPRQVRAGVSPALDNVCDQILGDPPRHHAAPITTAGGIVTALTKVLGTADAAPDLERRLRQPIPSVAGKSGTTRCEHPKPRPSPRCWTKPLLDNEPSLPGRSRRPAHHRPPRRPGCERVDDPPDRRPRPVRRKPDHPPESSGTQQRRRWIGLLLVLAVLLIAAGIISALILDRRISSAPEPQSSSDQQSTAAEPSPAQPSKLIVANARDFDPQGDDQDGES